MARILEEWGVSALLKHSACAMNPFTLTLLEATVTLYPADGTGAPVVGSPIWTGVAVENLSIKEKWLTTETRPTGALYPRKHPLVQQYAINLGRVWALNAVTGLGVQDAQFGFGKYVLDILWTDEDTQNWKRLTLYNVTISEHNLASRAIDEGFTDDQSFDAESLFEDGGLSGTTPPAISLEVPYTVVYVTAYGSVNLYRYDPATQIFTEAVTGITSGRATLAYVPTDRSGAFNVNFSGPGTVMHVSSDGVSHAGNLIQGTPNTTKVPRLDFYYGSVRAASITAAGELFAFQFADGTPTAGTGKFQIFAGGALALTMAAPGVTADGYAV
jgi:hypothetical protein